MTVPERAERCARHWHDGQLYSDEPYADAHLSVVAANVRSHGPDCEAVAWLHDILEDTDATVRDLFDAGMPMPVVNAVSELTRCPDETYRAYIARLCGSESPLVLRVKRADLGANIAAAEGQYLPLVEKRWGPALAEVERAMEDSRG